MAPSHSCTSGPADVSSPRLDLRLSRLHLRLRLRRALRRLIPPVMGIPRHRRTQRPHSTFVLNVPPSTPRPPIFLSSTLHRKKNRKCAFEWTHVVSPPPQKQRSGKLPVTRLLPQNFPKRRGKTRKRLRLRT